MKKTLFPILIFFIFISNIQGQSYQPKADVSSMIIVGNARFTLLTPQTIRMEWSENRQFEDQASLTVVNRLLPVPVFSKKESRSTLTIKTNELTIFYKKDGKPFSKENLKIEFKKNGKKSYWMPGMIDSLNLMGTTRTLDGCNGNIKMTAGKADEPVKLENGIVSRIGWTFIDDSKRPLFDNSDWPWVTERKKGNNQDWYFIFYEDNYKMALSEFTKIAGKIPIPPKFAFGYWYSKYWAYTDLEYKELVNDLKKYDLPIDVLALDMDWHLSDKKEWYDENGKRIKDQAGERKGWTGFTWNKKYFPSPEKFLQWTNNEDIKTCLNLHPASGIQPHEEVYPQFAAAMGIDPKSNKYIPFDITDKTFAKNYFDLILHPMEKQGVDFWWLDWQQWNTTKIEGVNPTFYLNYLHFSDMQRQNKARPIIFHRWGGLGNHRYQISFPGDTWISWQSLNYQPYFTSTASNVGFGYWSHDVGGHFNGTDEDKKNPELFTRWFQLGVFSPILRTHGTKDPLVERRLWYYPAENFQIMRDFLKFRYALIPYIYTAARYAHDSGISILRPMYYEYPNREEAYHAEGQYMFGNDMIVSPITHPMGKDSLFTYQKTWLPEGTWIEWSSGTVLTGGRYVNRTYTLSEIPVFVKSGAIIPMQPDKKRADESQDNSLILQIFPGNSGQTSIYDDEGNNSNYLNGLYSFTKVDFQKNNNILKLVIYPIEGSYAGMPTERTYELRLPVSYPPEKIVVNGQEVQYSDELKNSTWNYDGYKFTTHVKTNKINVHAKVEIEISLSDKDLMSLSGIKGKLNRAFDVSKRMHYLGYLNNNRFVLEDLVDFAQTGNRITLNPFSISEELNTFHQNLPYFMNKLNEIGQNDSKFLPTVKLFNSLRDE